MPSLPPRFNWGTEVKNVNSTLYNQLNDTYTSIARIVNLKVNKNVATYDPPSDSTQNTLWDVGDVWVNKNTDMAWIMTSRQTTNQATWTLIT